MAISTVPAASIRLPEDLIRLWRLVVTADVSHKPLSEVLVAA